MLCIGNRSNPHTLQELKTNITITINESGKEDGEMCW